MILQPIEYNNQRILTTEQLAEVYETDPRYISKNFHRNESRFIEGKHYYYLEGEALREFKTSSLKDDWFKHASHLYLWTERGANRHCKILDTDKAWEQFENLEETYFRAKAGLSTLAPMPPETLARLFSSAATYTNAQARILIHEGHTWHDVGNMCKDVAKAAGLPYSPLLGTPPPYVQLSL